MIDLSSSRGKQLVKLGSLMGERALEYLQETVVLQVKGEEHRAVYRMARGRYLAASLVVELAFKKGTGAERRKVVEIAFERMAMKLYAEGVEYEKAALVLEGYANLRKDDLAQEALPKTLIWMKGMLYD